MPDLNSRISDLIRSFASFSSWEERYHYIISLGKSLDEMDPNYKIEKNKVRGCQSQVWFHAERDSEGRVQFYGDSDAAIVKGLIAVLFSVYNRALPSEILRTPPTFLETIDLKNHLSMSRANGLNSMVKQISLYALAFQQMEA